MTKKTILILSLVLVLLPGQALAYSQEIGQATGYYTHPISGVIEDPGNNPGIGQGMVENVVGPQVLVETLDDGRIFVTVRYSLAEYLSNETFAVQNRGEADFYTTGYDITGSTAETRDYRIQVPSKDAIVRATFFVGPMGREVIFYWDFNNLTPGNTDFASLEASQGTGGGSPAPAGPGGQASAGGGQAPGAQASQPGAQASQGTQAPLPAGASAPAPGSMVMGEKVDQEAVNSKFSAGDLGYDHGLLTKDNETIQKMFYADEVEVEEEEVKDQRPLGPITLTLIKGLIIIACLFCLILALMAGGLVLYTRKVMMENDELREDVYD